MNLSEQEISELFSTLQNNTTNINQSITWHETDIFINELDTCRDRNVFLLEHLEEILERDTHNTIPNYVLLKGKYLELCDKVKLLETDLVSIKAATKTELQKRTEQHEVDIKIQTELEQNKLQQLEEQINEENRQYNIRAKKLYNELESLQLSKTLEQENIETELGKEVVDINMRITKMGKLNLNLQVEIDTIKKRQQQDIVLNQALQPIVVKAVQMWDEPLPNVPIQTPVALKVVEKKQKKGPSKKKSATLKEKGQTYQELNLEKTVVGKNTVESNQNKKKKRKLFDPDDLSYLERIQIRD